MAQVTTYSCDVCGRVKGEANHWFRAVCFERAFNIQPWDDDPTNIDDRGPHIHLCGIGCATKAMTKAMEPEPRREPEREEQTA